MTVTVRRATADDGRVIAEIRVASWRAAYDGLIPPVLLERLDVDREAQLRTTHWDQRHADPRVSDFVAHVDGDAVGWAAVGPCRDDDGPHRGELYALYALPTHWSAGVGHALMAAAEQALRRARFAQASLWVLDGNARAAEFYERHGWREDGFVKDDRRIVGSTGAAPLRERRRVRDLAEIVSR
ncbi:GNAT family N-acetyltransferase [Microbacterium terrisoli]|uniref:GNAT family N-acetyltransferase n=1 Tax=Microbacterium terrisoli TaxID=3242192 RepID=UPI002803BD68|nr:GNAT family N-acetyltransferase [Microbacterium protaetiae]